MSIYQDEFGAMWFGSTQGLNRYNGKDIEIFRPSNASEGLAKNTIYSIQGNKAGFIYILADNELVLYNLHTQNFEKIEQTGVKAMTYRKGKLWAVVNDKIMQYREDGKQPEEFFELGNEANQVSAMYIASDSTIWIGTRRGLFVTSMQAPHKQASVIDNTQINDIYEDKKQNIWVSTQQDGIFRISPDGNKTNFVHKEKENSLSNNEVRNILEDRFGKIWVATFYGLNQYDPKTGRWEQYIKKDNDPHSISHSSVFSLYEDNQGTLWIGTYFGGVNYFNPDADVFSYYSASSADTNHLSFPYVGKMTEDGSGNLWICTEGGALNCLNLKTRQFSRYMFDGNLESVAYYNQKSIWYREDTNILYIGMHKGGLAVFDIKNKTSKMLTSKSSDPYSLPNNTINKIQYYDGYLVVFTQSGLTKMDLKTNKFYPFSDEPAILNEIKGIGLNTFYIDSKDRLWVSQGGIKSINLKTKETNLYLYDRQTQKSLLEFSGIADIFESSSGDLFFATLGSGIFKYNTQRADFEHYNVDNSGLVSDYCYNIAETPSGLLILLHGKNFSLFDPQNPDKKLFHSSKNFPLTSFNIGNSSYVTRDNEIFIGGVNGLTSFRENNLDKIYKDYNLYFDKLYINNRVVKPGDNSGILKQTLPLCSEIELKYNQNNFSIEFATSDYLQTMTRNYQYKLEGFDTDWIQAKNSIISYTNLDARQYTLQIREIPAAGQDRSIHSLIIKIHPPFYLSPIAFVVYIILIFSIIVGVIRFYMWRTKLETTLEFERKDKERIEELNNTKLSFFTNVSHEFRTPLTLIVGQVEMLMLQSDLNPNVHSKLSKIHKNTNHLLNLISELLDFRKQEQGFYKLNIKHVELISYIKEIYSSFQDYARKKDIRYKLEYLEPEIHAYIDPVNLQKAIYNLLSNAFKYTSRGGLIKIYLKRQDGEVVIEVIDEGIGIPQKSLDKIFEKFYQLEHQVSGLTLGTGIGLALTKEIVEAHKGTITVKSTLNEGSTFRISLKLGASHFSEEELGHKEKNILSQPDIYVPDEKERTGIYWNESLVAGDEKDSILIVDDDEALLEMLEEIFTPYYNVYTSVNGKDALGVISQTNPDIVICDVMMPGMSGKEFCYRIKSNIHLAHIPVILLTAQMSDSQILEGYMFGANAYITKPFNVKLLLTQCNNLIKNSKFLTGKFSHRQKDDNIIFSAVSEHDKALMDRAVNIIKENLENPDFDMNKLGRELGMGRSKLYLKIKEITGLTPNELTLSLKLKMAVNLLDNNPEMNISDIAFRTGFSSSKYFSKCFKAFYGMIPQDWRKRDKDAKCASTSL